MKKKSGIVKGLVIQEHDGSVSIVPYSKPDKDSGIELDRRGGQPVLIGDRIQLQGDTSWHQVQAHPHSGRAAVSPTKVHGKLVWQPIALWVGKRAALELLAPREKVA